MKKIFDVLVAGLFKGIHDNPESTDPGVFLIVGFDNVPGGILRAGFLQHFIHGDFILRPFLTVAPVLIRNFPLLLRRVLPICKAGQLCILINVNPELDDDGTPFGQDTFKLIDFVVGTLPVIFRAESFKPLDHDPSVPGSVEDADMAGAGQPLPEPPQVLTVQFMRFRGGNRHDVDTAGIQRIGDTPDIAALSGGVPSLVTDHDRNPIDIDEIVKDTEALLQLLQFFLVILIRNGGGQINLRQFGHFDQGEVLLKG